MPCVFSAIGPSCGGESRYPGAAATTGGAVLASHRRGSLPLAQTRHPIHMVCVFAFVCHMSAFHEMDIRTWSDPEGVQPGHAQRASKKVAQQILPLTRIIASMPQWHGNRSLVSDSYILWVQTLTFTSFHLSLSILLSQAPTDVKSN